MGPIFNGLLSLALPLGQGHELQTGAQLLLSCSSVILQYWCWSWETSVARCTRSPALVTMHDQMALTVSLIHEFTHQTEHLLLARDSVS